MKICLFDWNVDGHHAEVAKAFARALDPGAEVVLAAAEATIASAGEIPAETISLGAGRPRPGDPHPSKQELAEAELDLIEETVGRVKPDHLILLWADPVLRWLLKRPSLPTAVSLYVAFSSPYPVTSATIQLYAERAQMNLVVQAGEGATAPSWRVAVPFDTADPNLPSRPGH